MTDFRTVLVTTDFSDTSRKAFPLARDVADKYGAKLVAVYVEEDRLPPLILEYTDVGIEHLAEQQHARAVERLAKFAAEEIPDHLRSELQVATGSPHEEIVRLAEQLHADLIVMATHGRGFISHAVLGSTTERVVRRAPCPVLVVRDTQDR